MQVSTLGYDKLNASYISYQCVDIKAMMHYVMLHYWCRSMEMDIRLRLTYALDSSKLTCPSLSSSLFPWKQSHQLPNQRVYHRRDVIGPFHACMRAVSVQRAGLSHYFVHMYKLSILVSPCIFCQAIFAGRFHGKWEPWRCIYFMVEQWEPWRFHGRAV